MGTSSGPPGGAARAPDPGLGTLALILGHARTLPGHLAVKDDDEALTYAELEVRVGAVARGLALHGAEPGRRVALLLPNSVAFVTVALACMAVGAPFVPLSPEDPVGRRRRVLEDCRPALVVTDSAHAHPVDAGEEGGADASAAQGPYPVHIALEELLETAPPPSARTPPAGTPGAGGPVAYVVYTSGSTGAPKGVQISASALRAAGLSAAELMDLSPTTRSLAVSSFHFDGSYGTLFPTLMAGGTLVIAPREELLFVKRFFSVLTRDGITHTSFTPSYLRLLLSARPLLRRFADSGLQTLALGGEACIASDIAALWEVRPRLRVFNRYGPTETTIAVTTHEVSPAEVASGAVPIGKPHPGVRFLMVDDRGNLIDEPDVPGELLVSGSQLMDGYLGDAELTARAITDAFGERAYRTGDVVCRDSFGNYHHLGRLDDVVKHEGVRISLTEIAGALRTVDGVTRATCFPVDRDGRLAIAAVVEADRGVTMDALRSACQDHLGDGMRPDELFISDALPMTPTGKVDVRRLVSELGLVAWVDPRRASGAGSGGREPGEDELAQPR